MMTNRYKLIGPGSSKLLSAERTMTKKIFFIIAGFILICSCTTYNKSEWKNSIISGGGNTAKIRAVIGEGELFKTRAKVTLLAINSGELESSLSDMINLHHPACRGMRDKKMRVPVHAYYIRHDTLGNFLIDTGCSAAYVKNPFGRMSGPLFPLVQSKTYLKPEEAIEQQLALLQVETSSIRAVFFTHLHFDHSSGCSVLPRPMLFVAGKGEASVSIPLLLESRQFLSNDIIHFLDFEAQYVADSEAGRVIDLMGDASVWAISTPGHSKGHVSYLVNTAEGTVLVAGDALMNHRSAALGAGPGKCLDSTERAQESFERLLSFVRKYPRVKVLAGHDLP